MAHYLRPLLQLVDLFQLLSNGNLLLLAPQSSTDRRRGGLRPGFSQNKNPKSSICLSPLEKENKSSSSDTFPLEPTGGKANARNSKGGEGNTQFYADCAGCSPCRGQAPIRLLPTASVKTLAKA